MRSTLRRKRIRSLCMPTSRISASHWLNTDERSDRMRTRLAALLAKALMRSRSQPGVHDGLDLAVPQQYAAADRKTREPFAQEGIGMGAVLQLLGGPRPHRQGLSVDDAVLAVQQLGGGTVDAE